MKFWKVAVPVASVLMLGACASKPAPLEFPVEAPAAAPADELVTVEDAFVLVLRDDFPDDTYGVGDDLLIDIGYGMCDALDSGVTAMDVIELGIESGLDGEFAAFMTGAAIAAFCPEYEV